MGVLVEPEKGANTIYGNSGGPVLGVVHELVIYGVTAGT
jgi:hypothetical protein